METFWLQVLTLPDNYCLEFIELLFFFGFRCGTICVRLMFALFVQSSLFVVRCSLFAVRCDLKCVCRSAAPCRIDGCDRIKLFAWDLLSSLIARTDRQSMTHLFSSQTIAPVNWRSVWSRFSAWTRRLNLENNERDFRSAHFTLMINGFSVVYSAPELNGALRRASFVHTHTIW